MTRPLPINLKRWLLEIIADDAVSPRMLILLTREIAREIDARERLSAEAVS